MNVGNAMDTCQADPKIGTGSIWREVAQPNEKAPSYELGALFRLGGANHLHHVLVDTYSVHDVEYPKIALDTGSCCT